MSKTLRMLSMSPRGPDRRGGSAWAAEHLDDEEQRDSLTDVPGGVRLQKVLAAAGVGSRRHCEELIGEGRVEVDGETVRRYDRGRPTIADFLGDHSERLYHVGRLDYDTEGLMLLMNDGELAHRLAHPRYGVLKTYLADVPGPLPKEVGRRLLSGVELADGVASADKFRVVEQAGTRALVEITLHEGRKHIVRRMLAEVGYPVSRLVRTHVGPVALGSLRPGTTRALTTREIGELYAAVGL
jgi:pseudouridine synthase